MKPFYLTLILTAFCACAGPTPDTASFNDTPTRSSTGRFNCDSDFANCVLTGGQLEAAKEIDATWSVKYDLPCFQSGRTVMSTIELRAGGDAKRLTFGARNTVLSITGIGPLSIIDSDPRNTKGQGSFDWNTNCGLTLSWTVAPSMNQISSWDQQVNAIKQGIDDNLAIYAGRRDIETFLDIYLANPNPGTKSILERTIADLRETGREMDQIKADQLQLILDNKPREQVLAPYLAARKKIEEVYIPKADALEIILKKWQSALASDVKLCLEQARGQLND